MNGEVKKQSGHRERLKTRFLTNAEDAHSDEALLELLLTYALPQKDVQPLARDLLATFGSLEGVLSAHVTALTQQDGIKEHTAVLLKAVDWIRVNCADNNQHAHSHPPLLLPVNTREASQETQGRLTEKEQKYTRTTLVTPSLFSDLADRPSSSKDLHSSRRGLSSSARSGLFSKALLEEAINILPLLPDTDSPDVVRTFLKQHLPFSGESTRERYAQYTSRRMFPIGVVDRALLLFARKFAGRQELCDVCFYRFCKSEPLMYDLVEQLILPSLGNGQLARSLIRDYLTQRFPGYASTKDCALAAVDALVSCGLATADRETLRFTYRTPSVASFAFVLHSEFPRPGMFPIAKVEQNRALHTLLWQPDSFLPILYELRNQQLISKISEIDALRQFTTLFTLDQLSERLSNNEE